MRHELNCTVACCPRSLTRHRAPDQLLTSKQSNLYHREDDDQPWSSDSSPNLQVNKERDGVKNDLDSNGPNPASQPHAQLRSLIFQRNRNPNASDEIEWQKQKCSEGEKRQERYKVSGSTAERFRKQRARRIREKHGGGDCYKCSHTANPCPQACLSRIHLISSA